MRDSNIENNIYSSSEESDFPKTNTNEKLNEGIESSKMDQSNMDLLEKRTARYTLSNYLMFSKLTNHHKTFLTSLHDEYIPKKIVMKHLIFHIRK